MTETKMITLLDDECIPKMPLDMLDEALIAAGFIRINQTLSILIKDYVIREKLKTRPHSFVCTPLMKLEVVGYPFDTTYWVHKEIFDNWPDIALSDELIEKGVIKDE